LRAQLTKPNAKLDPAVLVALRLGAFQLLYLDRIQPTRRSTKASTREAIRIPVRGRHGECRLAQIASAPCRANSGSLERARLQSCRRFPAIAGAFALRKLFSSFIEPSNVMTCHPERSAAGGAQSKDLQLHFSISRAHLLAGLTSRTPRMDGRTWTKFFGAEPPAPFAFMIRANHRRPPPSNPAVHRNWRIRSDPRSAICLAPRA